MNQPTYYTVLPYQVRLNHQLSPFARLLYSEIDTLSRQKGYCWASNAFFAELYQVKEKAVTRWLKALREAGYIRVEVQQGNQRKIFLTKTFISPEEVTTIHLSAPPERGSPPTSREGGLDLKEGAAPPKGGARAASLLIDKNNNIKEYRESAPPPREDDFLKGGQGQTRTKSATGETEVSAPHPPGGAPPPAPKFETMQTTSQIPGNVDTSAQPFIPPTLPEVEAYMRTQSKLCTNYQIAQEQAQRFVNHYQSNGWKVGRNPMQDWQAAANNWLLNMNTFHSPKPKHHETYSRLHTGGKKDYSIPL